MTDGTKDPRAERLKAELRANLKRRKAQARARDQGGARAGTGRGSTDSPDRDTE